MRALVADDDRGTVLTLARALQRLNIDVVVAADGQTAYDALHCDPEISLAVLDWMMPGIEGPELCRRIRHDPSRAHMYLLLLTNREEQRDRIAGLQAGADDYVTKPFDPDEFHARVQTGLRILTLQERLGARVVELEQALSQVKQLRGLLPICSYCKKIRNDQDYWEQVEHYVSQHTDVRFSHGICPTCYDAAIAALEGTR